MSTVEKEFQVFTSGGTTAGVPTRIAWVSVPVMTNMEDLKRGERLIMEVQRRTQPERKRTAAWQHAVDDDERKQKCDKDTGSAKQKGTRKLAVDAVSGRASSSSVDLCKQIIM